MPYNVASFLRVDWDPTGDPLSDTPTWVDITSEFLSCKISRGRADVFGLFKVGTLTLVARNGRKGGAAPWLDPETWYWRRQIRVVYLGGAGDIPLFTGYIATTPHDFGHPNHNRVTINAVDKLGILREEQLNLIGTDAADTDLIWRNNGLRLASVDAFVDLWSQNFAGQTIDLYGGSIAPLHFKATEDEIPDQPANRRKKARRRTVSGNFWQLLQNALEVEYGSMHVAADGTFALNGRYSTLRALADANQIVITDTPTSSSEYQIKLGTPVVEPPGTGYRDAAYGTGTSEVQRSNTANVPPGYPETTYSRTSLPCPNDNWVQANCDLWATLFSQTTSWMSKCTITVNRHQAEPLLESLVTLGRSIASISHTPAGDTQKTFAGIIEGVDLNIEKASPPVFEATLAMTDAARWESAYGTFDDYGVLGSTWTLGTSKVAP